MAGQSKDVFVWHQRPQPRREVRGKEGGCCVLMRERGTSKVHNMHDIG